MKTLIREIKITEQDIIKSALNRAVYNGFFVSLDFLANAEMETKIFYLPTYIYSGKYDVSWRAAFGFDNQIPYTDWRTESYTDSNGNMRHRNVPYTSYYTNTHWRLAQGKDKGTYWVQVYAGNIIPASAEKWLTVFSASDTLYILPQNYFTKVPFHAFTNSPEEIHRIKAQSRLDNQILDNIKENSQGDRQRDWKWKGSLNPNETVKAYVPAGAFRINNNSQEIFIWYRDVGDGTFQLLADPMPLDYNFILAMGASFIPDFILLMNYDKWSLNNIYRSTFESLDIYASIAIIYPVILLAYLIRARKKDKDEIYNCRIKQTGRKTKISQTKYVYSLILTAILSISKFIL